MQEFNEGDLVEAVKGERVVRDRITKPSNPFFAADLYLGTPSVIGLSSVASYINAGYTLTLIEKAAPPRPWLCAEVGETWRLEPFGCNYNVVRSVDRYFTRANVFGAVEVIPLDDARITDAVKLESVTDQAARILPSLREAAHCISRSSIAGTDVSTIDVRSGRRILANLITELEATL